VAWLAWPVPAPPPERGRVSGPLALKNQVRALRTQRNLAQGQLAEAMGVSRQTINSIENERYTPSLPLAIALARYFGVTVEEMFDEQGP
jgi:putative transcriptional regulator